MVSDFSNQYQYCCFDIWRLISLKNVPKLMSYALSFYLLSLSCLSYFTWFRMTSWTSFHKLTGASLNTIKRTVKYLCPADIIPPYIDVDLSELDVGQKIVMGDLKVHPALKLIQSKDEPVCKIMGQRVSEQRKSK